MRFIHALLRFSGRSVEAIFVPKCCSRVTRMDKRSERKPDDEPAATEDAGQRLPAAGPMSRLKNWARALRRDAHAIRLAAGDPRVPWTVKLLAIAVAGYALSPIDLIPDFIPVLGVLDDLIIVPLGIWLVIALIPEDVMREYRAMASAAAQRPVSKAAAIIIVALWISGAALLGWMTLVYWRL
jgi:uncharacterized membrane protein YkvA (DUF1232 family)